MAGCGDKTDKGAGEAVKSKEEIEAEKVKAHQDKWRAIIAKKESGESSTPDGQRQERPKDRPQPTAEAKMKSDREKAASESRRFSTLRLDYLRKDGIPSKYATLSTPLEGSWEDDMKGRGLYKKNCASCHGSRADGESAMTKTLTPPPTNLLMLNGIPEATDAYFFWTISEGGDAVKSAMPSFKELPEEDRWRIVGALRKGLK